MAGPLAGITAAQVAQQTVQEQSVQALKQGPSKFDKALSAQGPGQAGGVEGVHGVDNVAKAERAALNKVNVATEPSSVKNLDAVTQKSEVSKGSKMMTDMMNSMERGQVSLDKLIKGGMSGKSFSNAELISLQAGMYKYTQELELTSKVVEKATSGLKDTLKTQV